MSNPTNPQKSKAHPTPRVPRAMFASAIALVAVAAAGVSFLPTPRATHANAVAVVDEGEVRTTDGRVFEGEITESGEEVVVNRNGIVTRLKRSEVSGIEYGSATDRLRARLGTMEEGDIAGRLEVGREALKRNLFDVAEEAADAVEEIEPGNAAAARLLAEIARKRQLEKNRGQGAEPVTRRDRGPQRPDRADLLDEGQINRIRLAELQPRDSAEPPAIRFENNVIKRYVDANPDLRFEEFNQAHNDVEKALIILKDGDPKMRDEIRVRTDPGSLLMFKRQVHTAVVESCATSACHGGDNAGRFVLYGSPRNDEVIYTNFYTLTRTNAEFKDPVGGAFGGTGNIVRQMIDRDAPDQSLLLQFLLPADQVDLPHPNVEGFNARFRNRNDQQFVAIRQWIADALERGVEDYGIDFVPPGQPSVTTQPATLPSTPAGSGQ